MKTSRENLLLLTTHYQIDGERQWMSAGIKNADGDKEDLVRLEARMDEILEKDVMSCVYLSYLDEPIRICPMTIQLDENGKQVLASGSTYESVCNELNRVDEAVKQLREYAGDLLMLSANLADSK